ncbi:hypothetical protein [Pseudogemmobacter bohemicus]|uniref:hypothetical protein n=1 Tax=Pseudogemmobacter bohemicus TaxID=2250708 RepID=UPI001300254E|nr:hypothetical protein [Pseudogemmobacter bohemicus]
MQTFRFATVTRRVFLAFGLALLPITSLASAEVTGFRPEVVVANATDGVIYIVKVSPSESSVWGENLIEFDELSPGDVRRLMIEDHEISPSGKYDIAILLEDSAGEIVVHEDSGIELGDITGLLIDYDGMSFLNRVADEDEPGQLLPSAYRGKGPLI